MKKFLALLLAVVMVLSLAACGSQPTATPSATEAPAADATDAPAVEENYEPTPRATDSYSMIESFDITTLDYVYNNKSSNGDYTSNFI